MTRENIALAAIYGIGIGAGLLSDVVVGLAVIGALTTALVAATEIERRIDEHFRAKYDR